MRLKDQVAIVTGGGQGIGRETCLVFAGEGAHVIVAEQNLATAESVVEEVQTLGVRSLAIQTDVANRDSVRSMVAQTLDAFGWIDILVNNAGIFSYTRIEGCSEAEWDQIMAVNLKAVLGFDGKAYEAGMRKATGIATPIVSAVVEAEKEEKEEKAYSSSD